MHELIWMFPILFIVHDMEEIMGFGLWLAKNRVFLDDKYPKISNKYKPYSTEGMAAAVMEEMVVCLGICIVSRFTECYGLWLGAFVAYTIHLVVHIGQSIVIRKYIPAVITSIICLPISIWFIASSIAWLSYSAGSVIVYSLIGIVAIAGNLKAAHWIIHIFTKKMRAMEV
ncbi:MAG: HXXEE domain-containing protein [Coprococcus sp.]